jgi:chromosome segregation ATPase
MPHLFASLTTHLLFFNDLQGIVFSVRPPKKSWKHIANLSGGEKTLSSLSLVFALHHYKPTPLYVMDEIDAALDFKNVSIGESSPGLCVTMVDMITAPCVL